MRDQPEDAVPKPKSVVQMNAEAHNNDAANKTRALYMTEMEMTDLIAKYTSHVLPREKSIPAPREPTKWEKFAKEKGLIKGKRDRKVWNDETKEWRPRYGYVRKDAGTRSKK